MNSAPALAQAPPRAVLEARPERGIRAGVMVTNSTEPLARGPVLCKAVQNGFHVENSAIWGSLAFVPVSRAFSAQSEEEAGRRAECIRNDRWPSDGLHWDCLNPSARVNDAPELNGSSLVFMAQICMYHGAGPRG